MDGTVVGATVAQRCSSPFIGERRARFARRVWVTRASKGSPADVERGTRRFLQRSPGPIASTERGARGIARMNHDQSGSISITLLGQGGASRNWMCSSSAGTSLLWFDLPMLQRFELTADGRIFGRRERC